MSEEMAELNRHILAHVVEELGAANFAVCADIAADAKVHAPVRTGYLRAETYAVEGTDTDGEVVDEIHSDAPYAMFVNNGTYRTRPNPYMSNAIKPLLDGGAAELVEEKLKQ